MKKVTFIIFILCTHFATAQQDSLYVLEADDKYVEDQFYVGVNYNLLTKSPSGIGQSSFSYGIIGGFIKDIPINRRRNIGFGLGAGLSFNALYTDLLATEEADGSISYQAVPDDISYKRNKLSLNFVEFPIEFRWRSSVAEDYRFWRIYSGVRISYLFSGNSKFVTDSETIKFKNPDIRDLQYGIYLSFGYNTWNFYAQYDLTNVFEDDLYTVNNESLELSVLKAGLIFYIL
ncbi:porin family protein [Joostella sp. CR20]|uniref:porin family protein n=1 Tax=Joostella sp. CR20 TaxID=2804312 RepID=UPI00313F3AD3